VKGGGKKKKKGRRNVGSLEHAFERRGRRDYYLSLHREGRKGGGEGIRKATPLKLGDRREER